MQGMSTKTPPTDFRPPMPEMLAESGYSDATRDALMDLDTSMFHWHRKLVKGELTAALLAEAGVDLELVAFQGLVAIKRIEAGIGREAAAQPTIGILAQELAIDPSRASRIAADLIARGMVRREAAQDDGRKSVLALTHAGQATFRKIWLRRWERMLGLFSDWSEEEITQFSKLFGRYVDGVIGPTAKP